VKNIYGFSFDYPHAFHIPHRGFHRMNAISNTKPTETKLKCTCD